MSRIKDWFERQRNNEVESMLEEGAKHPSIVIPDMQPPVEPLKYDGRMDAYIEEQQRLQAEQMDDLRRQSMAPGLGDTVLGREDKQRD